MYGNDVLDLQYIFLFSFKQFYHLFHVCTQSSGGDGELRRVPAGMKLVPEHAVMLKDGQRVVQVRQQGAGGQVRNCFGLLGAISSTCLSICLYVCPFVCPTMCLHACLWC